MPAARQPQDHLPKKRAATKAATAKDEAGEKQIVVEYDGDKYTITRENADNLDLYELVEEDKYILALRGYLGTDQWTKWKDSVRDDAGRVSMSKFEGFLNAVMEAVGGARDGHPNS
jgi:hypothetical protein